MINARLLHKDKKLDNDPMLFASLDFDGDADIVNKLIELKELIERTPFIYTGAEIECLKAEKRKNEEAMQLLQKEIDEYFENLYTLPLAEYGILKQKQGYMSTLRFKDRQYTYDIDVQDKLSYVSSLEKTQMFKDMLSRLGFVATNRGKLGNTDVDMFVCNRKDSDLLADIDAMYLMTKAEQNAHVGEIYAKHRFIKEEREM